MAKRKLTRRQEEFLDAVRAARRADMDEIDIDRQCANCARPKAENPSNMPGDDLCADCRDREDRHPQAIPVRAPRIARYLRERGARG